MDSITVNPQIIYWEVSFPHFMEGELRLRKTK